MLQRIAFLYIHTQCVYPIHGSGASLARRSTVIERRRQPVIRSFHYVLIWSGFFFGWIINEQTSAETAIAWEIWHKNQTKVLTHVELSCVRWNINLEFSISCWNIFKWIYTLAVLDNHFLLKEFLILEIIKCKNGADKKKKKRIKRHYCL